MVGKIVKHPVTKFSEGIRNASYDKLKKDTPGINASANDPATGNAYCHKNLKILRFHIVKLILPFQV